MIRIGRIMEKYSSLAGQDEFKLEPDLHLEGKVAGIKLDDNKRRV